MTGILPGFSIIIPVRNGEKTLPDTLRSIANLTGDMVEVIIVDDGSTDGTAELAEKAGAKVVAMPAPSGPAAARNRGAREASYELLVFTDSDVLLPKPLLEQLTLNFENTGADCIQGTFSEVCPYSDFFSQYKNLYNRYVLNQLPDWIDTTYTSLTAVKKSAFLKCGGFDEGIRTASVEDRTLGRNLMRHGYRIWLDRCLEVVHNKQLGAWGFFRNQFRRSRDLVKLLIRNRDEKANPDGPPTLAQEGRFGTNTAGAMMRLPIAYGALIFALISIKQPVFLIMTLILTVHFLYLITPFTRYLLGKRGPQFAFLSMFANWLDALVSGLGVLWGAFEYKALGRRY